jgi:hypothetical protein
LQLGSDPDTPTFIQLPCSASLEIMKDGHELCNAIRCCIDAQEKLVSRSSSHQEFSNNSAKYMCVGTQAMHARKGLQYGYHCFSKKGFTNEYWDIMYKL